MSLGEREPSEGVAGENRLLSEGGNTWLEPVVKSVAGCSKPRGCVVGFGWAAVSSRSKLIFCIGGAPAKDAGSGQQMLAGDSGAALMTVSAWFALIRQSLGELMSLGRVR